MGGLMKISVGVLNRVQQLWETKHSIEQRSDCKLSTQYQIDIMNNFPFKIYKHFYLSSLAPFTDR